MWPFIIGAISGAILLALVRWLRKNNVSVTWYEWLIGIVGLLLLAFTIQNTWGSLYELESVAAGMMWLILGLPAIILLVVAASLAWRRKRSAA